MALSKGQVSLKLNRSATRQMLEGRQGPPALFVANYGRKVRGAAKRIVKSTGAFKSGKLHDSIDFRMVPTVRGWAADITADVPYASWIEDGKRYDPRAGRVVYVKVGARPFMRQAVNETGFGLSHRRRI